MFKRISLCAIALCTAINYANAQQISASPSIENSVAKPLVKPFEATYNVLHKSKSVGQGIRKLTYLDNGFAEYSYHTEIEWLIFSDKRGETSVVKVNGDKVIPTHYSYQREGTGKDKAYEWTYDIANNKATDIKRKRDKEIQFPDNIQDKLSYHFQHRLNLISNPKQQHFVYPVVSTSGKIKNYVYQYDGEEELMLPYGLIKTIRLKREVVDKKRVTYAWFAPELNHLLVKLYQTKGGVEQFEAQLTKLTTH